MQKNWIKILTVAGFLLIGLIHSTPKVFADQPNYSTSEENDCLTDADINNGLYDITYLCSDFTQQFATSTLPTPNPFPTSGTLSTISLRLAWSPFNLDDNVNHSVDGLIYEKVGSTHYCTTASQELMADGAYHLVTFDTTTSLDDITGTHTSYCDVDFGAGEHLQYIINAAAMASFTSTNYYTDGVSTGQTVRGNYSNSLYFLINNSGNPLNFINPSTGSSPIVSDSFIYTGYCTKVGTNRLALLNTDNFISSLPGSAFNIDCASDGTWSTTAPLTDGNQTMYIVDQDATSSTSTDFDFTDIGYTTFTGVQDVHENNNWVQILYPTDATGHNYFNNLAPSTNFPVHFQYQLFTDPLSPTSTLSSFYNPDKAIFFFNQCTSLAFTSCTQLYASSTNGTLDPSNTGYFDGTFDASTTPQYYQVAITFPSDPDVVVFALNFTMVAVSGDASLAEQPSIPNPGSPAALCGVLADVCGLVIPPSGYLTNEIQLVENTFEYRKPLYYVGFIASEITNYSNEINYNTSTPENLFNFPSIPIGGTTMSMVGGNLNSPEVQNLIAPAQTYIRYSLWILLLFYFYERGRTIFRRGVE